MVSIGLQGVTKNFGAKSAVDSVSIEILSGSLFGFLGQNGAGKTTTIRMISGLLSPDSGKILINGRRLDINDRDVTRQIGLLSDDIGFFFRLTLWEHLVFIGQLYGFGYTTVSSRAEELLRYLDAWDMKDTKAFEASNGTKKKLSLALSLIHNPSVLLLDEPFEGIDFISAKKIKSLLITLSRRGKTIFITSHLLEIVEQIIDSFAIISNGRIVHQSSVERLTKMKKTLSDVYAEHVSGAGVTDSELAWLA
jgi:ABC-2 type transport system ATP-binding protein